jgi:hypothetical protein
MSLFPLTQTYRFQIKVSYMDDYDRTVEMQSKTGVCIKGRPSKSTTTEDATQTSFKDFNPKFRWNGESDDDDLTQIDAFLMSQTPLTQPPGSVAEPAFMSQTLVDTPSSSQSYQPVKPTPLSRPHRPKIFSETFTLKHTADSISYLGASPVCSPHPPNFPKRAKLWKKHFTPADTDIRTGNGMVSRGTQTENSKWLTDTRAMENHIVDVVQNPLFDAYVARIKELMKGNQ